MRASRLAVAIERPRSLWLHAFAAWTLYGLVHGILWTAANTVPSEAYHWTLPSALILAWTWALFTPLVFRLARTLSPSRVGWPLSIVGHAASALILAASLQWVRREAIVAFSDFPRDPYWSALTYWFDVWLFIYITLVVIGRALDLRRRYADRTMRADLLETQLARAQLQYLESQLQPHFLFNALNTIAELAHEAPAAAERMLQRLRALLAISLERYGQDEVTLADELSALEPYLDIQRTRFSNWLTVDVDLPDEVRHARVPHLILQPLVENAIRHGVSVRQAPGRILITARRVGERLRVTVEDDGVGLSASPREARSGIGLRNVVDRLRQLYGTDHALQLRERPGGGAIVEFEVPFRVDTTVGSEPALAEWPSIDEISTWRTGEFASTAVTDGAKSPATGDAAPSRETRAPDPSDGSHGVEWPSPALSLRVWLGIAGIWLLLAVFWTNQLMVFDRLRPTTEPMSLWSTALLQLGGSAAWLVMSLPVLWLAQRFRFTPDNWPRVLPIHVAAALGCGFAHLLLLRVVGLSTMPMLSYLNLNPLTGDFFIYLAFLAWSHSRDFVAWFRVREIETARLTASIARSRFQALRVQLRPEFVLATLEYLERLVHDDVDRAERLIARLADTLRLTLDIGRHGTTSMARELELVSACIEAHGLGVRTGVRLRQRVDVHARDDAVPSRLICAMVDELLANVWLAPEAPLLVDIDVARVSGYTQVTIRAVAEGIVRSGVSHAWWHKHGVAERAVEHAGSMVSVLVPDTTSVMLMIGDDAARATDEVEEPSEVLLQAG
ncbi:MAG: histidine kinase [Gemmatimonadaceae bacterium]|nr:histidine kinase [Gemmatimonadaceae bacterium]